MEDKYNAHPYTSGRLHSCTLRVNCVVELHELNLVSRKDINALSEHADKLTCVSIHGVNKEDEAPPGVQTELVCHEGHMDNIWIHDAKFTPDESVDAAPQFSVNQ